jgi:hypothetical protein
MFTLNEVECAGCCVNAPMMGIGDDYYVSHTYFFSSFFHFYKCLSSSSFIVNFNTAFSLVSILSHLGGSHSGDHEQTAQHSEEGREIATARSTERSSIE